MSNILRHQYQAGTGRGSVRGSCAWPAVTFVLVTLVALIVRLHHLDHESLFMDELLQVFHYPQDPGTIVDRAASQQQTPLDYWIGHLVYRFSTSDRAVRLPAALFGIGSVLLVMLIVRRFSAWGTVAVTGTMMALLPFNLYYSQQARPYAIAVFFLLAVVAALVAVHEGSRLRWWTLPLLLLVTTCFLLSRTLSPLVVVTVLFVLLVARFGIGVVRYGFTQVKGEVRAGWAAGTIALSVLIYLPILMVVLSKGGRYVLISAPLSEMIQRGLSDFTLAPLWRAYVAQTEPIGYVLLPLVMLGPLLKRLCAPDNRSDVPAACALLLFGSAFVNILVFQATSANPFRPPYAIYVLPLTLILSAAGFQALWEAVARSLWRRPGQSLLAVVACGLLFWTGCSAWQFKTMRRNTNWRGLAQSLQERYGAGHALLFDSITKYGSWEPTFYGFPRYYNGDSPQIRVSALVNAAPALAKSTLEPVLILFVYPRYFLTPHSRYPVLDVPRTSVPVNLRGLEEDPGLEVQKFVGFRVIRLSNPTGRLGADTLTIVERLIEELPRNSCVSELHVAAASLRCALKQPKWQIHLESAESLVGPEWRDEVSRDADAIRERGCGAAVNQ